MLKSNVYYKLEQSCLIANKNVYIFMFKQFEEVFINIQKPQLWRFRTLNLAHFKLL